MAFTLDADPSSPTMNCFVTLEEADEYFSGNFTAMEAWNALSDDQKPAALRQATLKLNALRYSGTKTTLDQPLVHPRSNVFDRDGMSYPSDAVIPGVKYATCEMAYWIISESDRYFSDQDLGQLDAYSIGPINATKSKGVMGEDLPAAVQAQLDGVGSGFVSSAKGKNPTYAKL